MYKKDRISGRMKTTRVKKVMTIKNKSSRKKKHKSQEEVAVKEEVNVMILDDKKRCTLCSSFICIKRRDKAVIMINYDC